MSAADTARWRAAHPERSAASLAKYKAAHPERVAAATARWQAANPDRRAAANAKWRAKNPERHAAYTAKWQAANPEKQTEYVRARRARRLNAPGRGVTARQWAEILAARPWCHYCGDCTVELVQEHMTPLARGGAHDVSNVTPACAACNERKYTRTADEFMAML